MSPKIKKNISLVEEKDVFLILLNFTAVDAGKEEWLLRENKVKPYAEIKGTQWLCKWNHMPL